MAQPTESAILVALAAYRSHISEVNHRAMSALIPQIEAADMQDPDLFETAEEEEEMRVDYTRGLVGIPEGNTKPPIERPSDILDNWDILVSQVALDTASVNVDPEWRAARRKGYRSAILEGLGRLQCPTGQWVLPHDFEILMRHVDSLEGPGWRLLRDVTERVIFFQGWGIPDHSEPPDRILKRVKTGQDIVDSTILKGYNVAGGWVCGGGNESICYVFHCRPQQDVSQGWSWWCMAFLGQFGMKIFYNIVDILNWYKDEREPSERDFEVTAEEVFAP